MANPHEEETLSLAMLGPCVLFFLMKNCGYTLLIQSLLLVLLCISATLTYSLQKYLLLDISCCRLERIWLDELKRRGPEKASFSRAVFTFMRTRMIAAVFCLLLTVTAQFLVPVSFVRYCRLWGVLKLA